MCRPVFRLTWALNIGHVEGPEHSKQQHVPKEERKLAPRLQWSSSEVFQGSTGFDNWETLEDGGIGAIFFDRCLEVFWKNTVRGPLELAEL